MLSRGLHHARKLKLDIIRRDGETQCRSTLNNEVICEYAEALAGGAEFPPLRVWYDGSNYWLSDGFHRLAAAEMAGVPEVDADVHAGTRSDAQWDSYAANSYHGLRRSRTDVETTIKRALIHENAARLSNNELARHLGIPESTLRITRKRLNLSIPRGEPRRSSEKGRAFR